MGALTDGISAVGPLCHSEPVRRASQGGTAGRHSSRRGPHSRARGRPAGAPALDAGDRAVGCFHAQTGGAAPTTLSCVLWEVRVVESRGLVPPPPPARR